ncbi:Protein HOTHEAD [Hibiscus syriacus]|uniref:Protein HOTHEAD n=1 Tax=Hibiscus syriacus TaxID=106335 RepID=A0A6A2WZ21_HIBSY|nr:Protein HOTHEAD [Hibiscus syriacus]
MWDSHGNRIYISMFGWLGISFPLYAVSRCSSSIDQLLSIEAKALLLLLCSLSIAAFVGAVKLFICLVLWLNTLSSLQGARDFYDFRYPFIRKASSFSSASAFSSSNTDEVSYDYIIVGGGTSGCTLAATLSRNFSVLVLERGGVPFSNANVSFLRNFHIALADTSPTSASQPFVSTDGVINTRARVLGGGTCINAGFYTRANSESISDTKMETLGLHYLPYTFRCGVSPYSGFTYDHIYGTKVGGTIFDRFGHRHTAASLLASRFSLLASADPKMLTILVYATVQKVLFDKTGMRPKSMGVMFKDENGNQHQAGVGPKAELERLNISMVLHNEFVGKGMADNPMKSVFVLMTRPVEQSLIQTVGITKMGVYIEASSGFGQSQDSIRCHHGMLSAEIGQLATLPPKQRTKEATEAFIKRKKTFHMRHSRELHLTVPAASKETPVVPPQQQCSISFHHLTSCPSTPTVTRGCPFVNDIAPTTTTQLVSSPASNARGWVVVWFPLNGKNVASQSITTTKSVASVGELFLFKLRQNEDEKREKKKGLER